MPLQRGETVVRHARPEGFVDHAYEAAIDIGTERRAVWAWLNDPDTFVKGQMWPFRVEFVEGSGVDGRSGFALGVQNVHHGPLLSCAGEITAIDAGGADAPGYRDLQYYYGSFILSHRLIRPSRLEFWVDGPDGGTDSTITLRVESMVKPWFAGVWTRAQGVFWRRFFAWTARSAAKRRAGVHPRSPTTETHPDG